MAIDHDPASPYRQPQTPEAEVPHSGVHHDERPVRDFDNTTLQEAVDQGYIKTPETPAALIEKPKKNRRGLLIGVGAGAAGLALAVGAFVGIKGGENNTGPVKDPKATSEVSTPPSQGTEKAVDPMYGFKSIEDSPVYKALNAEQKAAIDKYGAMDLVTFRALPANEQFVYAQFLMDVWEPYAVYELQNHQMSNDGNLQSFPPNMLSAYKNPTLSDNGQTIANGISVRESIPMWSMTNYGSNDVLPERRLDAQKMVSAVYAPTDHPEAPLAEYDKYGPGYSHVLDFINNTNSLGKPGAYGAPNDGYFIATVTSESATTQSTVDPTVHEKIVNANMAGQTPYQERFVYTTLPDITGKERATWRISYSVNVADGQAQKFTSITK